MRNTIIVTAILFIAVIGASIYYFGDLNKDHKEATKPLQYLPENTLLVLSIRNDEITDNIFKDFEVFDAILGFSEAERLAEFKKKLLRNDALKPYVLDAEIYISFHPYRKKSVEALFTIPNTEKIAADELPVIIQQMEKEYEVQVQDTLNQQIYSFNNGHVDSTLYVIYYENILFASYAKPLLAAIVSKETKHLSEQQVDYFIKNSSRNTPLSIFFPHQQLPTALEHFQRTSSGSFIKQFEELKGQSAWNINFKQDALMLTGESEVENTQGNYIALFRHQRKKTQYLHNFFPSSTAVYMEYSISDRRQFTDDISNLLKFRKENDRIYKQLTSQQDTTVIYKLQKALGLEFALIEQPNQTNMGYISLEDPQSWNHLKSELFEDTGDSIYRFKHSNLLYTFYGDAFKIFPRPYVTQVANVLVVANSSTTLREYQKDWKNKNLLTGTLGFKSFEKLQGNEANITLFVHTKNANSKILNSLPQHYQQNFRNRDNFGYQDFYSWSVQLSGNNGNFLSRIYGIYKSKTALGATSEWIYPLENRAITRPYIFEHSDTSQFILLQELDHTLHAIAPSGAKIWSSVFSGRVVGDLLQIADRSIILVTDRNRLYRFDTSGKPMKGFSTGVPEEPIATPTIASVNGQSLIMVPTKKKIYTYNMEGSRLDLFQDESIAGEINGSIQVVGEYFAIGTTYGRIYLFDKQGRITKHIDAPGNVVFRNPIGTLDEGNTEFSILATDTASNIYKFSLAKAPVITRPDKWNAKFYADFVNVASSNAPEMVVVDGSRIHVYAINDTSKLLFEYNFTKDISDRPQYFGSATGLALIGIASKSTNLIYLLNADGSIVNGFPVEGQPLFYYGKINYNSDTFLLCMRRDHKLYAFRHQK
ncbi:hypothetical protein FAZ19_13300 [Sphingobacterium alkalisoli]|uniref:DUF3352 domain-containing protein n=1 Tax=Sphingobacterium alkalisoli TaxID=1874115 RepID=A0A4U0GZK0_9SPHI|nr:hypothetical protein [Sphingobacterium alkalisoli]TJY64184.1 hypothetical protein FAZ19_13300 [Sphingobacterium alkalisoli]GGH23332.1 hypothetical protein GCM10011418_30460 [Sphingobacterium alkalisoli]